MNEREFNRTMEQVIASIKDGGYEPYDQLYGYIMTGEANYITRNGNARAIIKSLDFLQVKSYVLRMRQERN